MLSVFDLPCNKCQWLYRNGMHWRGGGRKPEGEGETGARQTDMLHVRVRPHARAGWL